jgi:serine/threonine protein kinase
LQSSETGKWLTKPYGCDLDLSLQDGSLTPQSFEQLHNVLLAKKITCGSVADLGSEAGHAVAQFAFKPFVNQVIGIEIQYAWLAYSVIIMQHLQAESCKDEYYLADIHILHGSFLDTTLMEWEAALSRADLCFCNNVNWEKGARARPVPQEQQSMKGEYRNSINANVAHLLVDIMKLNSHVLVFDAASFANQAFQRVQTLNLMATWSTLAQGTQVHLLKTYPTHFKVLQKALKTLCQAKNCNFESLPRDWWEHEVQKKRDAFLRLNDHVMNQDYFAKSNASVHWGWNVTVPMIVCIKKFPDRWSHAQILKEIGMLNKVANSDEASRHSVIRFFGTDIDRQGGTVLIFERVDASSFDSDLENMTAQNIVEYMYKLLQALNYLHKQDVVHRDVKPANFLHNFRSKTFRLIDFGSAERGTQGFVRKGGGTRGFRAPEILIGEKEHTAAVDVWSAGIILLTLITGKPNILSRQEKKMKGIDCDAIHLKEIGCIVGNSEMRQIGDHSNGHGGGIRHENNTGWAAKALQSAIAGRKLNNGNHALDLLSKMLKVQPSKRITTEDALKHPFLQSAVNRL